MANPWVVAQAHSFELLEWTVGEHSGNDVCLEGHYKLAKLPIAAIIDDI
jgi:hypothetical protein